MIVLAFSFFHSFIIFAQNSPATLPDLKLSTAGNVNAIAVQPDGRIIIGGTFTSENGNGSVELTSSAGASEVINVTGLNSGVRHVKQSHGENRVERLVTVQGDCVGIRPQLDLNRINGLALSSGGTGAIYRVELATNFSSQTFWMPLTSFNLTSTSLNLSNTHPATNGNRFYRAVLVP